MAKIYQRSLFSWKDVDDLGDLKRLKLAIENMPDEKLMRVMEKQRDKGRNDYPIRVIWNCVLAGIVFDHPSIESLIRELQRNAQLRELCGCDPLKGTAAVPSKSTFSRFLYMLVKNQGLINEMFDSLVKSLRGILPDFGKELAFDGKAIKSLAKRKSKEEYSNLKKDLRRENEAEWGVKKYHGEDANGNAWTKTKFWFGFRLHLVVEANYELPIAYEVTKASTSEKPVMKGLFRELADRHPELIEDCDHAMGDKGYDTIGIVTQLWDNYKIKPIIDIRDLWKDGETTRLLNLHKVNNVTYDYRGTVFCHCPRTGEIRKMACGGFEKERNSLKYLCPAAHYGIECKGASSCPVRAGMRISLAEDRRVFTPVSRSSYKWKKLYNKRSSVERVNSRFVVSFGLEKHYIRGLKKMRIRCGLAICVMLSMALGRVHQNQLEHIRSLVKAA